MAMITCIKGHENPEGIDYCLVCGALLVTPSAALADTPGQPHVRPAPPSLPSVQGDSVQLKQQIGALQRELDRVQDLNRKLQLGAGQGTSQGRVRRQDAIVGAALLCALGILGGYGAARYRYLPRATGDQGGTANGVAELPAAGRGNGLEGQQSAPKIEGDVKTANTPKTETAPVRAAAPGGERANPSTARRGGPDTAGTATVEKD